MTHEQAREVLLRAFAEAGIPEPTTAALQAVGAVCWHETGYGQAWRGGGVGSHNWGAVQGTGSSGSFTYTDTHPTAGGASLPYQTKFRCYATDEEGALDVIRILGRMGVLSIVDAGNATQIASEMYFGRYFEGFGKTVDDRIAGYAKAIYDGAVAIANALGEDLAVSLASPNLGPSFQL